MFEVWVVSLLNIKENKGFFFKVVLEKGKSIAIGIFKLK